ncbi:MAG TPA: bifunctional DNA-formamidopyrimidine glycosylase/DNA-(apurinic or apyrimidinic site) lyase [Symbiobacteriaceae bacterium]|jgi:formamidopyrimidine-DNA glycosylase
MPELPEVETVRSILYGKLVGKAVDRVEIITPRQIYYPDPNTFKAEVEGARFTDVQRRGKYLLLKLGPLTLICHLRMSGHFYVCEPDRPRDKHTHVVFHLSDGNQLRYEDQRKFGGFHLLGKAGEGMPPGLAALGPEPLSEDFTPDVLSRVMAGRRAPVKAILLDQSKVAGLGNIYADEVLFCAQVHPERPGESITPAEVRALHGCIRDILAKAIEKRGTTFSLYLDGEGQPGDMYDELQVFDRAGDPCPRCGTLIMKLAVAGRGSHVCPACQLAPAGARLQPRRATTGRRGDSPLVAAEPARPYQTRKRKTKGD